MEYNVDLLDGLDIYHENSLTLMLKQITPGSNILEFGPAYGRMTRFLKENLRCRINCVEINPNARDSLEKYAEKVIIGNIEDYEWVNQFVENEFDYVIFADVLEHLIHPADVLKSVIPFIKLKGKILISVPNIAHNAIIRSLYANKFQYQEDGILDKTHVRFFTIESLETLIKECGLNVCSRLATYYNDEMTGVLEAGDKADDQLQTALLQRPYANVYQFVYTLCKEPQEEINGVNGIKKWHRENRIKLYLDRGEGFSEENIYELEISIGKKVMLEFPIDKIEYVKNIRIDPVEKSCICQLDEIIIEDDDENIFNIDSIESNALYNFNSVYIFDSNDPQFVIYDIDKSVKSIRVSIELLYIDIVQMQLFGILSKGLRNLLVERDDERNQSNKLEDEIKYAKIESEERATRIAELNGKIESMQVAIQQKKDESEERATRIAELNGKIEGMQAATQQKKDELEERAIRIAELSSIVDNMQTELEQRAEKVAELSYKIDCMQAELRQKEQQIFLKNLELIKFQNFEL